MVSRGNKTADLIQRFKWMGFLLVSLLGENLQYLSFRCFSQLFELKAGRGMALNIVTCYSLLFVVVFYAASSYFLIPSFSKSHGMLLEGFSVSLRTVFYMVTLGVLKVFNGMVHSLLYGNELAQTGCLLVVQLFLLVILVVNRRIYSRKMLFVCHLAETTLRTIIHFILIFETLVDVLELPFSSIAKEVLSESSDALLVTIFFLCVADIMFDNIIDFSRNKKGHKIQILKEPKEIAPNSKTIIKVQHIRQNL